MATASTQDIKRRIKSVSSIEHITNAMKLVSTSKLRRAKMTFERTREYFHFITESIESVFSNREDIPKRFLHSEGDMFETTCYIVITSNRGLCGSFNSNVIKETESKINRDNCANRPIITPIGIKGRDYFSKRGYEIFDEYLRPPEDVSFIQTHDISQPIIELYDQGKVDRVVMVATSFITSLEQRVQSVQLLPFEIKHDPEMMPVEKQVEYEPSSEEVFNYLVPKYVEMMIYGAIVESATCEHAARRIAMENATDNANQMIDELSLSYNRARQAAITNEITEIVSGADALK